MTTPLLTWTADHRIGIEALDFEHQDLFARINELNEELIRHDDKAMIEDCLGEIHARMSAHFALEEKFMRDKKYPYYEEHKREHDRFLDDFVDAMAKFENDPGLQHSEALQNELKRWIVDHVLTSDKKMSAMARSKL